jgi:hypothetical protein
MPHRLHLDYFCCDKETESKRPQDNHEPCPAAQNGCYDSNQDDENKRFNRLSIYHCPSLPFPPDSLRFHYQ